MALTPYSSGSTRVVQAKGDITDFIFNIDITNTPILSSLKRRGVSDIDPAIITDTYRSSVLTNYHTTQENAPAASDTTRAKVYNYMQLFMATAEVTDTQNAIAQYGMGQELPYQEAKKLVDIAGDAECTLLSDQTRVAPTDGVAGKMNGMTTIISTNYDANTDFSQANFDAQLAACAKAGGKPTIAYMDDTNKIAAAAWSTAVVTRYTDQTRTLIQNVNEYEGPLAIPISLVWHWRMPQDVTTGAHCLILQPDLWEILTLTGDGAFRKKTLPDNGSGPSTLIKGQMTIICHAEKGNSAFK